MRVLGLGQSGWDFECIKNGQYRNPEDCATFIQCSNGQAYVQTCPTGLHFSVETERCEPKCGAICDESIAEECGWDKEATSESSRQAPQIPTEDSQRVWDFNCVKDGMYQNLQNCSTFIHCSNGQAYVQPCPAGLHFSAETQRCESKCDAHCDGNLTEKCNWDQRTICRMPADKGLCRGSLKRWYFDVKYSSCKSFEYGGCPGNRNNFKSKFECERNCTRHVNDDTSAEEDSPQTPTEDSAQIAPNVTCVKDGIYPDPDNCERFVQCSNGRAFAIPCPRGLHHSEVSKRCESPCDAHCKKDIACQCGWPECSELEVDCEARPVTGPCHAYKPRYYYDRETGKCQRFVYSGCGGNTNNFVSERECKEKCQKKLLGGYRCPSSSGKFGDFFDCISYYQCNKGEATLKRCPSGLAFDHKKSKCVIEYQAVCLYRCRERDAVFPYHPDCHKYIDCVNGISKVERCPPGQAFDWSLRDCTHTSTDGCSSA